MSSLAQSLPLKFESSLVYFGYLDSSPYPERLEWHAAVEGFLQGGPLSIVCVGRLRKAYVHNGSFYAKMILITIITDLYYTRIYIIEVSDDDTLYFCR